MRNNKIITTLVAGMLLLTIIFAATGCSAKKASSSPVSNSSSSGILSSSEILSASNSSAGHLLKSSDGKMSLDLGTVWNKATGLWPTAQLQASMGDYPNVIVIEKSKSTFAAGYTADALLTADQSIFSALL